MRFLVGMLPSRPPVVTASTIWKIRAGISTSREMRTSWESWINEKLQTALDESYRDPTNLQVLYCLPHKVTEEHRPVRFKVVIM